MTFVILGPVVLGNSSHTERESWENILLHTAGLSLPNRGLGHLIRESIWEKNSRVHIIRTLLGEPVPECITTGHCRRVFFSGTVKSNRQNVRTVLHPFYF